jgi:hypothetical protein
VDELLKNKLGLQVLTDTGWSEFDGILVKGTKQTAVVRTTRHAITCTLDHGLFLRNRATVEARSLKPKQQIVVNGALDSVVSVTLDEVSPVYDLFNVKNNHRYYANDILVKNCEFLIYDETLVNSETLAELEGTIPIMNMGQTRWYHKVNPYSIYVLALDPSLGTGGNSAGIQVFELPSFIQVAEWHNNTTPIQGQIRVVRDILTYIQECVGTDGATNVYWSLENNTVGEAGLVCIKDIGEENFPGLLISEPLRKGHIRKFRKGFNTTHKSKISAAAKLKYLIETGKMKLKSKPLISELKSFIATGVSFNAKTGEEDDLVSALLLIVRMSELLADWDPRVFAATSVSDHFEDYEMPMPIFVTSQG